MMAGAQTRYAIRLSTWFIMENDLDCAEFASLVNKSSKPYLNGETIRLDGAMRMAPK